MTYILIIWTVVAMGGDRHFQAKAYDYRPIGEFHAETNGHVQNSKTAQQLCEAAAKQLGLKSENYRCVRNR